MVFTSSTSGHSGHQHSHHHHSHHGATLNSRVRTLEHELAAERPENKVYDSYIAYPTPIPESASAQSTCINSVPLQTGDALSSTRIGQQVRAQTILLKYVVSANPAATSGVNFVRVLLVSLYQDYSETMGFGAGFWLEDDPNNGTTPGSPIVPTFLSPYSLQFKKLFKVHYDKTHALTVGGTDAQSEEIHLSLGGHIVQFYNPIDEYTTPSKPIKNSLWLVFIGDNSTHYPSVGWYTRFMFTDA